MKLKMWFVVLATLLTLIPPTEAWAQPKVVNTSISVDHLSVPQGADIVLAVVLDHRDEWHTNPNIPTVPASWSQSGFEPWPTTLGLDALPSWATVGKIQWPQVHEIEVDLAGTGVPEKYGVYEGRAIVYVPVRISDDAPTGQVTLNISIEYQACADSCLPPMKDRLAAKLEIVAKGAPSVRPTSLADFVGFDRSNFDFGTEDAVEPPPGPVAANRFQTTVFGYEIGFDTDGFAGKALLLLSAMFGGLILNLTPCVLPVIPLKIMSLQHTAKSPQRSLYLGIIMALGVVTFWAAIGGFIGFSTSFKAASQLIAVWWFTVAIGVFVGVMGVGMMGAFTIGLPQWIYSIDANHESARGSFIYGLLTAVLALPCVAPFAGAAMAVAAYQGPTLAIAIFAAIGMGMSLPYVILAAKPNWVSFVPSAGEASDLLKQIMGLFMVAASLFFVGTGLISLVASKPYLGKQLHWWMIALVLCFASFKLATRTFAITKSPIRRTVFAMIAAALAFAGVRWAMIQTANARHEQTAWTAYSDSELKSALAAGKVVVVDFTADWCLICKSLESAVLSVEPVATELSKDDVVTLKADLTSLDAPGWTYLKDQLKQSGIPLLVIYGPGLEEPVMSGAYTSEWVMDSMKKARE